MAGGKVHYADSKASRIAHYTITLCGEWRTRIRRLGEEALVTCPTCLERLAQRVERALADPSACVTCGHAGSDHERYFPALCNLCKCRAYTMQATITLL